MSVIVQRMNGESLAGDKRISMRVRMKIDLCFNGSLLRRVFLCLLVFGSINVSFALEPTEAEWQTWPPFCKAGFLASQWGKDSATFRGRMPAEQVASYRRNHDSTVGIPGVHHFCMGMVDTNRARTMPKQSNSRRETLDRAVSGIYYSFKDMTTAAPRYSLVTAHYGTALYLSGKRQQAFDAWQQGIEAKPASRESYLAMAEALLWEKKAQEALDVLLRYDQAKETDAADAEAFISHAYIELGLFDKAREHADKAYQLGYPLPGLRNKLERLSGKR